VRFSGPAHRRRLAGDRSPPPPRRRRVVPAIPRPLPPIPDLPPTAAGRLSFDLTRLSVVVGADAPPPLPAQWVNRRAAHDEWYDTRDRYCGPTVSFAVAKRAQRQTVSDRLTARDGAPASVGTRQRQLASVCVRWHPSASVSAQCAHRCALCSSQWIERSLTQRDVYILYIYIYIYNITDILII
jgi:hypothetical protein